MNWLSHVSTSGDNIWNYAVHDDDDRLPRRLRLGEVDTRKRDKDSKVNKEAGAATPWEAE